MHQLLTASLNLGNKLASILLFASGIFVLEFPGLGLDLPSRLALGGLLEFLALSVLSVWLRFREAERFSRDPFQNPKPPVDSRPSLNSADI